MDEDKMICPTCSGNLGFCDCTGDFKKIKPGDKVKLIWPLKVLDSRVIEYLYKPLINTSGLNTILTVEDVSHPGNNGGSYYLHVEGNAYGYKSENFKLVRT